MFRFPRLLGRLPLTDEVLPLLEVLALAFDPFKRMATSSGDALEVDAVVDERGPPPPLMRAWAPKIDPVGM